MTLPKTVRHVHHFEGMEGKRRFYATAVATLLLFLQTRPCCGFRTSSSSSSPHSTVSFHSAPRCWTKLALTTTTTNRQQQQQQQPFRSQCSSSLLHAKRQDDNDNKDIVSIVLDLVDGIGGFLSRPVGTNDVRIPTLYPILLILLLILTPWTTFLWFTGIFVTLAYFGRSVVGTDDVDDDDDENNVSTSRNNLDDDVESIWVPTDVFALLGAIVTTGLLAPPPSPVQISYLPSASITYLPVVEANSNEGAPLLLVVVAVAIAGLAGWLLSSSTSSLSSTKAKTRYNQNDSDDEDDEEDDDRSDKKSPDRRLLELWDEKFNQGRKKDKK